MKTLEQLKSEAREKYRNLPNFKTLPKENQEVILENNDTLITIAFNAGLERAVEVVEKEFYSFGVFNNLDLKSKVENILSQLQAEVNKDNK